METKRCLRFYTIADYEQEQKWLNDMSRGGWNFIYTNGFVYTFEKGTPGEYIYKLDLPNEQMTEGETEAYYKFMEECGIEVVHKFKMWRYLRKKQADGDFEQSNNTLAQLAMINKAYGIANKIMNTIIVIFALIIVLGVVLPSIFNNRTEFISAIITTMSTSGIIALSLIYVPITRRLRQRMNALVEELQIKN